MLPLPRDVRLGNGKVISTPLLIPSLSSRATGPIPNRASDTHRIELTPCSIVHSRALVEGIGESLLVSAYDICYGLLEDSGAFQSGFKSSRYSSPRLLFIDCGWYERNGDSPDKQFGQNQYQSSQWEESEYQETIDRLDSEMQPIVVSWDRSGPYREQIAAGQDFFGSRPALTSTMLLKPPGETETHDFRDLSGRDAGNLRAFDIVGVTEKEIGDTVLDRLLNIARLRQLLDDQRVDSPIHVFGGLDPLYTPLYFAAGGELFDGLGWLRYAYRNGIAMHRDAALILDREITTPKIQELINICIQNLGELRRLTDDLRLFAYQNHDWKYLTQGSTLELIVKSVRGQLGE